MMMMGRSCTKAAADALAKAEEQLCIGRSSNVYRLDDGSEDGRQVIIESWEEAEPDGIQFDLMDYDTGERIAIVTIDRDGQVVGGPLYWHKAIIHGDPGVKVLPPREP
jgi:hypothetical protein